MMLAWEGMSTGGGGALGSFWGLRLFFGTQRTVWLTLQ